MSTLSCFCVIGGILLLHLVFSRLFKIPYEYVILGITGPIADGGQAGNQSAKQIGYK